MSRDLEHGTIRILITSIDGNTSHPFQRRQSVGDVRKFGYDKLVQDKRQVPLDSTWIEKDNRRLEDATVLDTLVTETRKPGNEPDLVLSLAWTSQGG